MTRNSHEVRGQQYIVIQTDDPAVIRAINGLMPVVKTASSLLAFEKQPQPWEDSTPTLYQDLDALFTKHHEAAREHFRSYNEHMQARRAARGSLSPHERSMQHQAYLAVRVRNEKPGLPTDPTPWTDEMQEIRSSSFSAQYPIWNPALGYTANRDEYQGQAASPFAPEENQQ